MKRILSCFVFILFGIALIHPISVSAQSASSLVQTETMMTEQDAYESQQAPLPTPSNYALPYPGMLPDHPLFFLKQIRDRVMEQLISDPIKKAEFYLLQADKRLAMALTYNENNKKESVLFMIAEDVQYYKKLSDILKGQTTPVPGYVASKIRSSLDKHIEVVTGFANGSTGQDADRFGSFVKQFSTFRSSIIR